MKISFPKLVLFINAVIPLVLLLWDLYRKQVGPNPLEFATRTTGMLTLVFLMVMGFTFFYTMVIFQQQNLAENLQKQSGFIPGYRPGLPTERYLQGILNRITLPGSLFLMVIAVVPLLVFAVWDIQQFPFGGTAILITVGVALETMKQIDSQLMMRNYEGFLK